MTIRQNDFTIGYIELKLPNDSLENKNHKKQFDKYKDSLENIIFTNLRNWQLFQWDGNSKSKKVKEIVFNLENPNLEKFKKFLNLFLSYRVKSSTSSVELAVNLAKRTKILSEIIESLLENENVQMTNLKENFRKSLLHEIGDKSFANLIAETFTYSLFIASIVHLQKGEKEKLSITTALDYIPKTIPILYDLYDLSKNLSRQFSNVKSSVELILKELNLADLGKIVASFEKSGDPILNFYEPFLQTYDPHTKKDRGVFYTPKAVVDFLVRETNTILKTELNLENGFLERNVKVLDPATGTGTFLSSLISLVQSEVDENFQMIGIEKDKFADEVHEHILKNFYGFEFMVAPYTVAHLKLWLQLKSHGLDLEENERFQIYLANTLDDPNREPLDKIFFEIAQESEKAKAIKNDKNIIAIIGNPPYSGTSQNPSKITNKTEKSYQFGKTKNLTWIGSQIENYKWNGDKKLDEKNPKWLQDDYVKFIRFAQYQIDSKEKGVISYIVPHGFLDNPTFRYMRKSLLDSFSKIFIVNLHGNSTKKETTPNGGKDENVFDIKQGVSLLFLVKTSSAKDTKIYYGDLWGLRKEKFQNLENGNLENICKTELFPKSDMFYFIPRDTTLETEYLEFWSLKDIFDVKNTGIISKRDKIVYQDSKEKLLNILNDFHKLDENIIRNKYNLTPDSRDWKVSFAKNAIAKFGIKEGFIIKGYYRPFDTKWTYYVEKSKGFMAYPTYDVMKHMLKENIALLVGRAGNVTGSDTWDIVFIADSIVDLNMFRRGGEVVFPLYKYSDDENSLFETKSPNFTNDFLEFRKKELSKWSDEEIFYYIYGLLFSPNYREKYREFLQTDFPRIDFSRNISKISKIGKELADLHLLKHKIFSTPKNWKLKKVGTDFELNLPKKAEIFLNGKIYFNSSTYLSGIADEVWNFHIGGYQVLYKWLADRNGKTLSTDDLLHYIKIVVSLQETVKLMKKL
ncbi:putative helicase [Thiovulum sp. ES]|nr:putative helicase [Thiovulum sp. ES]